MASSTDYMFELDAIPEDDNDDDDDRLIDIHPKNP